jgi:hypothetical protein
VTPTFCVAVIAPNSRRPKWSAIAEARSGFTDPKPSPYTTA